MTIVAWSFMPAVSRGVSGPEGRLFLRVGQRDSGQVADSFRRIDGAIPAARVAVGAGDRRAAHADLLRTRVARIPKFCTEDIGYRDEA
jgi:hypothetical protein